MRGPPDADAARRGWTPVGEPYVGSLQQTWDEADDLRLDVSEAGRYTIAGLCDRACTDLDIVVTEGGRQVAADLAPDATPVVGFDARAGTRYTYRVTAPGCRPPPRQPGATAEPTWACMYTIRVYRQDR